ncbi:hypothetical protein GW755_02515 [bacterium]|nr:hypothetical protein [bacterium]
MLFKGLINSFIGVFFGNIIGFFKSPKEDSSLIWKGDPYYKQPGKVTLWMPLSFGIGFILMGLPWVTFIQSELIFRVFGSVFVSIGYFALTGFTLHLAQLYMYDNRIEVRALKQLILVINSQDIVALLKVKSNSPQYNLLYKVRGKYNLLSSLGLNFYIPVDILKSKWGVKEIEVADLDNVWSKNSNASILDKALSYLTRVFNPFVALVFYIAIYGPFANFFTGLLVLESISIFFSLITKYFINKYSPRLNKSLLEEI